MRVNGAQLFLSPVSQRSPFPPHLTPRPLGKNWHTPRTPLRLSTTYSSTKNASSSTTSYALRTSHTKALAATKAKEKEMKDEKEADRAVRPHLRPFPLPAASRCPPSIANWFKMATRQL